MQTRTSRTLRAQLELFHPPSQAIHWHKLPREIRQRAVTLLSRLLREHGQIPHRPAVAKEGGHE
jgi:hypothetical protein